MKYGRIIMNYELVVIWEDVIVAYIKPLFQP